MIINLEENWPFTKIANIESENLGWMGRKLKCFEQEWSEIFESLMMVNKLTKVGPNGICCAPDWIEHWQIGFFILF